MAKYIEREAAIEAIAHRPHVKGWDDYEDGICRGLKEAEKALVSIPVADVQPVRHGRWQITDAWPHNAYCSECHTRFAQTHWAVWEDGSLPREYCPNCGAKMDGGLERDNEKRNNG